MTKIGKVWMSHYLPPISFGGCEDMTLTLAKCYGGKLFCPRSINERRPGFISGAKSTYDGIYQRRGISRDRVFFAGKVSTLRTFDVDTLFVMGVYWPEVVMRGIQMLGRVRRIIVIPMYHVHDGAQRLMKHRRYGFTPDLVIAFSKMEGEFVGNRLGNIPFRVIPHLPGLCVGNEVYATSDGKPNVSKKVAQLMATRGGYALFPPRASKGLDRAMNIAARLGLPLVGNQTYCSGNRLAACVNFDREDPYAGAKVMISLTHNDSYNIGVAKAIAAGVPSVIDKGNTQIEPIWRGFQTVLFGGPSLNGETLRVAGTYADQDRDLLFERIEQSREKFEKIVR